MDSKDLKEVQECIRKSLTNGFMDKVTLAINNALKPLDDILHTHEKRITVIEKDEKFCPHHKDNTEKLNTHDTMLRAAKINSWIMHAQWFVIATLSSLVAYLLRGHIH